MFAIAEAKRRIWVGSALPVKPNPHTLSCMTVTLLHGKIRGIWNSGALSATLQAQMVLLVNAHPEEVKALNRAS